MQKKEISEIKKLFTENNCSITRICGCYVDGEKNKKAQVQQAFLSLPEDEIGKYFEILRKTLSGTLGKNLHMLEFPIDMEQEGKPQNMLLRLRNSQLKDTELLDQFYADVIDSFEFDGNYLILVIHDIYDIPGKSSDGKTMEDASEDVYEYIMVCICPVKLSKPGLSYETQENAFHNRIRDWVVGVPETGILFPAFNDRMADIHNVLYYSKDMKDLREKFVDAILGCPLPAAPVTQKETFHQLVKNVLGNDGNMEIIKEIQENVIEMIDERDGVPLVLDRKNIKNIFSASGISEERMQTFDRNFDLIVGPDAEFYAGNIVNKRVHEIKSPGVHIEIDSDYVDRLSTKVIDGKEVLVIDICETIEVNGIPVKCTN